MSRRIYLIIKRVIDFIGGIVGIVLVSPILLITAILIKLESKGNVIFSQKRVGLNGKEFKIYKFRSMVADAEFLRKDLEHKNQMSGPMFKIKRDPRVTKIGRVIRKTSIDELPQLINVVRGEMSLVGPRPSLPSEVKMFEPWMMKRLEVKPGLTCYWQVAGRSTISFHEWMKLDLKYIEDKSLSLDFKLIYKTFFVLFGDKNAY